MLSWDRGITEISDKLWLGIDYMSGNNANGELGIGGSWAFTKQVTLLVGVQIFNPGYKPTRRRNDPRRETGFHHPALYQSSLAVPPSIRGRTTPPTF